MSDHQQDPTWYLGSDGRWYPPQQMPPPAFAAQGGQAMMQQSVTSGLAVASLVLAIVWLAGLGSILAVIFALIAQSQIRSSNGLKAGSGLATAGLVVGVVGIIGAIATFVLAVVVGTATVTAFNQAMNPKVMQLGRTAHYSGVTGAISGASSITVYSYLQPVVPDDPTVTAEPGKEYGVADVQVCAGPDGFQNGMTSIGYALLYPGGTSVTTTSAEVKTPALDTNTAVGSGGCVRGYVAFQVAAGTMPSSIEYFGSIFYPVKWLIPAGGQP